MACCCNGKDTPVNEQVKKDAAHKIHAVDFVHGDLRPQNIPVVNNTIRILDFDWAGKVGEMRYPKELNSGVKWRTKDHKIAA